jgi:hypothetical protein
MSRSRALVVIACGGLLAGVGACGYGFPGTAAHLPADARSISVRPFRNDTSQIGVELALARAIEDVIRERGVLRVAPGEQGDLVLSGAVRSFGAHPVGFSRADRALQYETTLTLDVILRRRSDGRVVWEAKGLRESQDAPVSAAVVIPSSPRFQLGTLDAGDLTELTEIQLAEDRRNRDVVQQLADTVARSIYSQMLEGF